MVSKIIKIFLIYIFNFFFFTNKNTDINLCRLSFSQCLFFVCYVNGFGGFFFFFSLEYCRFFFMRTGSIFFLYWSSFRKNGSFVFNFIFKNFIFLEPGINDSIFCKFRFFTIANFLFITEVPSWATIMLLVELLN